VAAVDAKKNTFAIISEGLLEERLKEWAMEYGGGKYDNLGFQSRNILQRLIEHGGFVPDSGGFRPTEIRTRADEVEKAVNRMEQAGWRISGAVLRLDYFCPKMAMPRRLEVLRAGGFHVARSNYYFRLHEARAFVAGMLAAKSE